MAPNEKTSPRVIAEEYLEEETDKYKLDEPSLNAPFEHKYLYRNILFLTYVHIAGIYGIYVALTAAKWYSAVIAFFSMFISILGISAGAHRLYSHKAYKAKKSFQVLLMLCHSLSYQRTMFTWVKEHRLHHKYSDTDADPHNANRGLFFSHIGWLFVKRHPEYIKKKALLDMSDIYENPVLRFQHKHKAWFLPLMGLGLPTGVYLLMGESLYVAWHLNMYRLFMSYTFSFLVNSLAHSSGYKPYDKSLKAVHSLPVILGSLGEGFHNYHHVFPWDYRTAELGNNSLNFTTAVIDYFAKIGWAYDLKTVPESMIRERAKRTGDGTDLWGNVIKNDA